MKNILIGGKYMGDIAKKGLFGGLWGDNSSLLFFFLLLVIIVCNCGIFGTDNKESLLFFFLLLVVLFGGKGFCGC